MQIATHGPEGKALPAPPLERQGQLLYLALRLGPRSKLPTKKGDGMDQELDPYGWDHTRNDMFFVLAFESAIAAEVPKHVSHIMVMRVMSTPD